MVRWSARIPGKLFLEVLRICDADPLKCQLQGPMRVIVLIEDAGVIRRILEHPRLWAPLGLASWPRYASLPFTYLPTSPDLPHEKNALAQPRCGKVLASLWRLE
ncbi:MAG: hypothetical protein A3G24_09195 [Betaproteobacteria bacterium RIFCSPLOWO2_12_FULL_62_13]|nr:MAG: hypothetical protein A3G24_09195 [Betaproteobacteria bacterium RIFCSPLOWO2_12_FULL_62_13]